MLAVDSPWPGDLELARTCGAALESPPLLFRHIQIHCLLFGKFSYLTVCVPVWTNFISSAIYMLYFLVNWNWDICSSRQGIFAEVWKKCTNPRDFHIFWFEIAPQSTDSVVSQVLSKGFREQITCVDAIRGASCIFILLTDGAVRSHLNVLVRVGSTDSCRSTL